MLRSVEIELFVQFSPPFANTFSVSCNTMTKILQNFQQEIIDIFKAYRMAHFSLYNMKNTFYNYKQKNPQLQNFVLEDIDFKNEVRFNEDEINKNGEDGQYQRIIAGNTIAMFYNIWEDKYRNQIAKNISKQKNDVKSELFKELNLVRQSITHNNYNSISDLNKLEILSFVGNSKILKLSSYEVQRIQELIINEIEVMKNSYCS